RRRPTGVRHGRCHRPRPPALRGADRRAARPHLEQLPAPRSTTRRRAPRGAARPPVGRRGRRAGARPAAARRRGRGACRGGDAGGPRRDRRRPGVVQPRRRSRDGVPGADAMTLLRLELLRMVRTHRWLVLVGIYVFFGVLGPLTARYLGELIERFGTGDMVIEAPEPEPVDGVVQFVGNASQLGLLAVVVVAAAALSLDARPEVSAFLRTRVERAGRLLVPRFVVVGATAVGA